MKYMTFKKLMTMSMITLVVVSGIVMGMKAYARYDGNSFYVFNDTRLIITIAVGPYPSRTYTIPAHANKQVWVPTKSYYDIHIKNTSMLKEDSH